MSLVKLTTEKCLGCGCQKYDDYDALCRSCERKSHGQYRSCRGCKTTVGADITACTACIREYPMKLKIIDLEERIQRLETLLLEHNSPSN
jgi:hypothetical protein